MCTRFSRVHIISLNVSLTYPNAPNCDLKRNGHTFAQETGITWPQTAMGHFHRISTNSNIIVFTSLMIRLYHYIKAQH